MVKRLLYSEAIKLIGIRWSDTDSKPVCPHYGSVHEHYYLKTRNQYRCKECFHTFSVTSGTIFASYKKPLKTYLFAIALFTNAVKSISALQLSRDLDVQYKTAWVLSHKIRESLINHKEDEKFEGTCEMDGVYVNHYIRPKNHLDKRVVISLRQRAELNDETVGAVKTKTFVLKSENSKDIRDIAYSFIKKVLLFMQMNQMLMMI